MKHYSGAVRGLWENGTGDWDYEQERDYDYDYDYGLGQGCPTVELRTGWLRTR